MPATGVRLRAPAYLTAALRGRTPGAAQLTGDPRSPLRASASDRVAAYLEAHRDERDAEGHRDPISRIDVPSIRSE